MTTDRPQPARTDEAHLLARQLVELSALTGGLAHEIRNPLSTLKVNLQLLDEDWAKLETIDRPDPREAQDVARRSRRRIASLVQETHRLERILADFLQFVGKRELRLADADLNTLVSEMADFYAPQARAHGIALELHCTANALPCRVDAQAIKQALLNLLINAQQAMPGGGRITLSTARDDDGHVRIDVEDTGPGIDPAEQEDVFRAYYSTKKGGTGLGLAMARRIAHEHGGDITLASTPGCGARFSIRLPGRGGRHD
ncbi:MAG: hypothetical protein HBSAPP02_00810 [Phycisphaerae bacterium]|nr:MAG: two-component sensor histidine kinase [Planctomycetia bacterium]GJQ25049.1 MAG: hypothetical protein HBSAPP02_00810 [Phycisphaerae bacterium]